jgi:tetratricopeptide (TPR) repeat protein
VPTDIERTIVAFLAAATWDATKEFLEAHPELLTDELRPFWEPLLRLAVQNDDKLAFHGIVEHQSLIESCRVDGIDKAFSKMAFAKHPPLSPSGGMSTAHRDRVSALLQLLDAGSADDVLMTIWTHPILFTPRALAAAENSVSTLSAIGEEGPAAVAKARLALLLRMQSLAGERSDVAAAAIQGLAKLLMTASSSTEKLKAVLVEHGDLLLTDTFIRYLSDVIITIERRRGDGASLLVGAHQIYLRYLRTSTSDHPILSFVQHQRQIASIREELRQAIEPMSRSELVAFLKATRLYLPYLIEREPECECRLRRILYFSGCAIGDEGLFADGIELAQSLMKSGNSSEALLIFVELSRLATSGDRQNDLLVVTGLMANALARVNHIDEAIAAFEKAIELARHLNKDLIEESLIGDLGHIYTDALDLPEKGLELHSQALEMCRRLGEADSAAMRLNSVALDYERLGNYERAMICCQEAIAIMRRMGGRDRRTGKYLRTLASIRQKSGDMEGAVSDYLAASDAFTRAEDTEAAGSARRDGELLQSLRRYID